jgi:hypothetical protein
LRRVATVILGAFLTKASAWGASDENVEFAAAEAQTPAKRGRIDTSQVLRERSQADVGLIRLVADVLGPAVVLRDLGVDSANDLETCA